MSRLYIPFSGFADYVGGPGTFMRNLQAYLDRAGFPYTEDPGRAGGIFFPIIHDLGFLRRMKARRLPIIQRLDGIYFPSRHGRAIQWNHPIRKAYERYATHAVFQSRTSRDLVFAAFGRRPGMSFNCIYNGAHKSVFSPAKRREPGPIIQLVSTGTFNSLDSLVPMVRALDRLIQQQKTQLVFHLAGPIKDSYLPGPSLEDYLNRPYIRYHGVLDAKDVAQLLRQADAFLYSTLGAACPNAIIEAVCCGLPVVAFNSGAVPELVPFGHDLLAPVADHLLHQHEDVEPDRLKEKLALLLDDYSIYRARALEHHDLHAFERCGASYVELFNRCLDSQRSGLRNRPTPKKAPRVLMIEEPSKLVQRGLLEAFLPTTGLQGLVLSNEPIHRVPPTVLEHLEAAGLRVFAPGDILFTEGGKTASLLPYAAEIVRKENVSLVHVPGGKPCVWFTLLKVLGVPLAVDFWSRESAEFLFSTFSNLSLWGRMFRQVFRAALARADVVVFPSSDRQSEYSFLFGAPDQSRVIRPDGGETSANQLVRLYHELGSEAFPLSPKNRV